MKSLVILILLATPFTASAKCDPEMKRKLSCEPYPQSHDNKILSQMADKIDICTKDSKTYLALEAEGERAIFETTYVTGEGFTNYQITETVVFSVGSKWRYFPGKRKIARLLAPMGNETAQATFICSK